MCSGKYPTNYLQSHILTPALGSSSQPKHVFFLMDLPLRKANIWVLPAPELSCQGPTETLWRGWTLDKQQWDPQSWGWHSSSVFPAGQDTAKSNLCIAVVIPTCPVLWMERRKLVKSQLQIREHCPFCWFTKSFLSPPTCTELPADTQEDKDVPAVEVCKFFSRHWMQGMLVLCCQMWLQAQTRLIHSCCWATNSPLRHSLGTHGPTLHSQILQQTALTNVLLTP